MRRTAIAFLALALPAYVVPASAADREAQPEAKHAVSAPREEPMPKLPAPKTGSMPTGPAPTGKLGTSTPAQGKLGTEPSASERQTPPPRMR